MDIEFHYWITGLVARKAGFSEQEAQTIAYASQFTDDNDLILEVEDRYTGKIYRNHISQTLDITKPMERRLHIYPVFHFVPGDYEAESARRNDGKMHLLNTTPGSDLALELMKAAFKASEDTRLFRIGIASHAFADTWAHQNFVGFNDSFNGKTLNPFPNIGHADFFHDPDVVGNRWEDPRLVHSYVDNNLRFTAAACALLKIYCDHNNIPDCKLLTEQLYNDLQELWGGSRRSKDLSFVTNRDRRINKYAEKISWLPNYSETTWLDASVDTEVHGIPDLKDSTFIGNLNLLPDSHYWRGQKEETPWYRFQEAVKDHQRLALSLMEDRYKHMGLDARFWSVS